MKRLRFLILAKKYILAYLRLRYMSEKVKRMLKRMVKPKSAMAPIQNQFSSGLTSKSSRTATPRRVILSDAFRTIMH